MKKEKGETDLLRSPQQDSQPVSQDRAWRSDFQKWCQNGGCLCNPVKDNILIRKKKRLYLKEKNRRVKRTLESKTWDLEESGDTQLFSFLIWYGVGAVWIPKLIQMKVGQFYNQHEMKTFTRLNSVADSGLVCKKPTESHLVKVQHAGLILRENICCRRLLVHFPAAQLPK